MSLQASVINSISEVDADIWNIIAGSDHPFTRHEFLKALEESGCVGPHETGWVPHHIVIKSSNDDEILALMPLYLKMHSQGEYVFDHSWADAYNRAGGNYYPKLQSSIPFSPVTGPRLLTKACPNEPEIKETLIKTLKQLVKHNNISSLHITFLQENTAKALLPHGFLLRNDQQFHWFNNDYETFDDFLEGLASRKRKQIKKERKIAVQNDISISNIEGKDIQEKEWEAFFDFYMDTGMRKWGRPYLNLEFFLQIGRTMPDKIMLTLCYRDGNIIAGALNFKSKDTLYGRYWGCNEDHPCLHFEVWYYQAIEYAIAHKIGRGYVPTKTWSAHYIPDENFHRAIEHYLKDERDNVDAEINYLSDHLPFKVE